MNFYFDAPNCQDGFTVDQGTLTYGDKALSWHYEAHGMLCYDRLYVPQGHPYSMKMPLRNTIMVRLQNDSEAKAVRIWFITDQEDAFTAQKTVTFPLSSGKAWQTCYFNLSQNEQASGYLRGFRIEPMAERGTLSISRISFEREAPIYDYAGTVDPILVRDNTVFITGTLRPEYANVPVQLYETTLMNVSEEVRDLMPIQSGMAKGQSFLFAVPFMRGNVSRLTSTFIVTAAGQKVAAGATIANWADFAKNPYAFSIPSYRVRVTDAPFYAAGDGVTDDTAAIQAAINAVAAHGGGTVILSGEPHSRYGRRYVATTLTLQNDIELVIEQGAVLWQSQYAPDYPYPLVYGHDADIEGVQWAHVGLTLHMPLLYANGCHRVRITGGGTVRMLDWGSEAVTGCGGEIWIGCEHKPHVIPIGFYACEDVEVSDITILRTNVYHTAFYACKRVFLANMTMHQATCASADGLGIGMGTKEVRVHRCLYQSNDDGLVLSSSYNDPRGIKWWRASPDANNSCAHVKATSCLFSSGNGKAIAFIPWGSDAPDLSKQEIFDIEVTDCVLQGGFSVGVWPDNPFHGKQPFDNSEMDDWSYIRDIRIHDNLYLSPCSLAPVELTNAITDCGIVSSKRFQNEDFTGEPEKTGYRSGLAAWSRELLREDGTVKTSTENGKTAGSVSGARLFQGLHLKKSQFLCDMMVRGTGVVFIRTTKQEPIAEQAFSFDEFTTVTLSANLPATDTYYLGVESMTGAEIGSAQCRY